jgi:DNA-directed RNA polymerase subunit RPC12/RpoP
MISQERIVVRVNSNHLKYYKNLGYDAKMLEFLAVLPQHLPHGSHVRVNLICDICKKESQVEFRGIKDKVDFKYSCGSCSSKRRIKERGSIFSNPKLQKELSLRNNQDSFKKRKDTKLHNYGNENYNNQEKRKNTLKNNHGDERYNNQEKRKNTLKNNHGDERYNNQKKKQQTCLLKYGVIHTNQLESTWKKIQESSYRIHKYKDTNLTYQGSYELDFLEFCEKNLIPVENGPIIFYSFEGGKSTYHSDFVVNSINTIVEIKSKYTLEYDIDRNLAKKSASENLGYNFIFIVDKDYKELIEIYKDFSNMPTDLPNYF